METLLTTENNINWCCTHNRGVLPECKQTQVIQNGGQAKILKC